MANIQPLEGNVLLEPVDADTVTSGGIIIPESSKESPAEGTVVALGASATDEIAVGDRVIYKKYGGTSLTHEGSDYLIVPDTDILAKHVESDEI